jgi:hypothetical protein
MCQSVSGVASAAGVSRFLIFSGMNVPGCGAEMMIGASPGVNL